MGVIGNCCSNKTVILSSSISIYSLSEIESTKNNNSNIEQIPNVTDLNQAYSFIISKEYYPLLRKKIKKHLITKKLCQKLNNTDILKLINNLFEWIKKAEFENCDESTKKNINIIKENTKVSLNYILDKLKNNQLNNEKINIFMLQSLTHISIIVQCILYLVYTKSSDINQFSFCIWENKNIIGEAKLNAFQAAYFLLLVKKMYDKINKNNGANNNDINNENKITKEKNKEINDFYKLSINFSYDLINS